MQESSDKVKKTKAARTQFEKVSVRCHLNNKDNMLKAKQKLEFECNIEYNDLVGAWSFYLLKITKTKLPKLNSTKNQFFFFDEIDFVSPSFKSRGTGKIEYIEEDVRREQLDTLVAAKHSELSIKFLFRSGKPMLKMMFEKLQDFTACWNFIQEIYECSVL